MCYGKVAASWSSFGTSVPGCTWAWGLAAGQQHTYSGQAGSEQARRALAVVLLDIPMEC